MTQFKKIIFMDSDTMAMHNLDHLFGPEYPMFSGEQTAFYEGMLFLLDASTTWVAM